MNRRIYGYLRASTKEQDANRAKARLEAFAGEKGVKITAWFIENVSGNSLERPKLFEMLSLMHPNDIVLIEAVDRLTRLNKQGWDDLKAYIHGNHIRIVSLDLPTSFSFVSVDDEFTNRMLDAVNSMMLDMLAAISHKDYEDRRRRQLEGQEKARLRNPDIYSGRKPDKKLHENILKLLKANYKYDDIQEVLGCSRTTIAKVKKLYREQTQFELTKLD